jgi:phosphohistidine swiveling domain-containing protein
MIIHENNYTSFADKTLGGKAKHLLTLTINGFNVPKWCVIPENYFINLLAKNKIDVNSISVEELKKEIENIIIDEGVLNDINTSLNIKPTDYFAVRSSANDEDGASSSFAGQYDSYLFVSPKDIEKQIKNVWLSAFSEHIITYRAENNLPINPYVSVIIQNMIDSDVSGVAFGANPVTGKRNEKIISSLYGLGEGLVSGELDADNYRVVNTEIKEELANKNRGYKYVNNKLAYISIEDKEAKASSLNKSKVLEIASVTDDIKSIFNKYQDIEFCYKNNELFILQARPITNLNQLADISSNHQIWDNSNIVESYPGVSSPLTFSFILKMYESVYIQFCDLMGVHKSKIKVNEQVFANMLGTINGKVYYNLVNWYKVLSLFPGYALNKKFMEEMMGVKESINDDVAIPNHDSKLKSYRRLFGAVSKMIKEFRTIKRNRTKFLAFTDEVFTKNKEIDFDKLSASEIMTHYQSYEKVLLEEWRAPLINDFFAMIFFGILKKKTEKLLPDNPNLANDLLIGSNDIVSVQPVILIEAIRQLIKNEKACYELFKNQELVIILRDLKKYPKIKKSIDDYIALFGDRCTGELKLETKTYSTNPIDFISLLKDQIDITVDINALKANGKKIREEAESLIKNKLKGKWLKRRVYNYQLKKTRELVSQRENLRFERTKGFGFVRKMFNALGKQFYTEGILENIDDIFYLKQDEIFDFVRGSSVNNSLTALVELRKSEYQAFNKNDADDRFETHGVTYMGNKYRNTTQAEEKADLSGIGCSPGIIEQEVQIVHSPRDVKNLNGKIMVCESTDPGWVTLFPTCSAIIVERGSLLSHSAIVSREMGIPCIVGVSNALTRLKNGDRIKINGSSGKIELLNEQPIPQDTN